SSDLLAALAGRSPSAVICEILNDDGSMARLPDLVQFAKTHQLMLGSIANLIQYRSSHESLVEEIADRAITLQGKPWRLVAFTDKA
ncbi:MAG TPA: bifunctional 3,4-dihydroxy-2-butanone-4-phosphate synthase/GTP cyclohydrolase II, partial [Burkholderiales bacterium]|nr:bifunctional 3,4-dihydroxy-2-butanone-4-phosphate synthase/GTP cyclohydrolase II [Burkholderiales bacterium]